MDKVPPPRRWVLSGPDFPVYREAFPDDVLGTAEGDTAVLYVAGVAAFAANAEGVLRRFARSEALRVLHLWDAPDVVRRWLETGDESLRAAAKTAARAAARDAARDAAGAAAWDAAVRRLVGELDGMLTGDGANTVEVG